MNINIQTDKIKKALAAIQSICQKKTISEFTQNALIQVENNELIIKATDLETNVEIYIGIDSIENKNEKKKTFLNARIIYDLIREIEQNSIDIEFYEERIIINSKNSTVEIKAINPDKFRESDQAIENIMEIKRNQLINLITFCSPLSTNSIQRNTTASILFEMEENKIKGTATDGHCLSHITINNQICKTEEKISFLISKKAASDIKKVLESVSDPEENVIIGKSATRIAISGEKFTIYTKNLNENFPLYEKIINEEGSYYNVNRTQILKTAKKISLFTENKFIPAKALFSEKNILFSIENSNMGSAKEEIEILERKTVNNNNSFEANNTTNNTTGINFFPPYLLKAITEIQINDTINIIIKDRQKPIIIKNKDEEKELIYAVMPMSGI